MLQRGRDLLAGLIPLGAARQRVKSLWGVPLYSNAFYLMMNSVLTAAAGIVFWVIAARFYSSEDVGVGSAAISAISLLALFSSMGLEWGLMRFLPGLTGKSRDLLNSCFSVAGVAAVALSLIFLFGLSIWSPALIDVLWKSPVRAAAFVVFTATYTLYSMSGCAFIARRRTGFILALGVVFNLFRFAPLLLLVSLFPQFGIITAWGISTVLTMVTSLAVFLPRVEKDYLPIPAIKKQVIGEIAHFSVGNYAANLLAAAPGFVFPLMVVNRVGAESNAYFYVAWAVATLLNFIAMGFSLSLLAEGSRDEANLKQHVRRSLKAMLILLPAVLVVLLAGDKMLLIFGGSYSENATTLLWLLALSSFPQSINYIYLSTKRVRLDMKSVLSVTAFTAGFALVLSYFLLPRMGIVAVGVAWLAAQAIAAVVTGWWMYAEFIRPPRASHEQQER